MRVLITGAGGFLGRHLRAEYAAEGHSVTCVELKDPWRCEMTQWLARHPMEKFDLVFHCAALVDGRETIEAKPAELAAYNLALDASLFTWAALARPGRIVYFSSSAAYPEELHSQYGKKSPESAIDILKPEPADMTYGWTKLVGERLADEFDLAGLTDVTVVRPFSIYGADQDTRYPFPAFIDRAIRREDPFVVWGDGYQVRDFVHVDDAISILKAIIAAEAEGPVNIGTGIGTKLGDLAKLVCEIEGYEPEIRTLEEKPRGVEYRVADTRRMQEFAWWSIPLRAGIREALDARRPA